MELVGVCDVGELRFAENGANGQDAEEVVASENSAHKLLEFPPRSS